MLALIWHPFNQNRMCISDVIGIIPLFKPYLYSMCIGKGVLTRHVSEAFFIMTDPGGYEGEKPG